MTAPEQWPKVKEIVGEALEREAGQRAAFLDLACLYDGSLRAEVESLLKAYDQADGFSAPALGFTLPDPVGAPSTIGPYRLERELGAGGMGQVWLAEQTEPVQRWIALKLIRAGFYDSSVVQRFLAERQSLALMNHPAIAKVFDAGTTPAGQPYFAMEYVEGLSITAYCDEKKLGVSERLKLFLQVCEGVQHAHQKAIIHRDLKPSNILVVEVDGRPAPRIIDFGLAKSAKRAVADELFRTQVGAFLGTPGYMSPEQADPGVEDVDTRTDVYSLGVVLYELLSGCLPFEPQDWKNVHETDPQRPSTKAGSSKTAAIARGMEARELARLLRGDLDWITLKALERDRDRRYGTPSGLAADIERYLESRPVHARPASRVYRIRKYIRRNRMAVSVATGALALLIAFAVTQSIQLRHIKRERDRGDRVTQFMTGMFRVSDPSEARGNSITAREILDKSARQINTELVKDPELQAQMMEVMGRVYEDLGLFSHARPLLERSVASRRRILGPRNPKTLQSMDDLAWLLDQEGRPVEAAKLQQESLDLHRAVQGSDHPDTRKSISNLAIFLADQGRFAEAEKLDRESLEIFRRSRGPEHPDTVTSMNNLAADLLRQRHYPEAKTLLSQALNLERRSLGPQHPVTLASMNNLAAVLMGMGQYAEAEKLQKETRGIQRRVLGPDHPDTAGSTYNLACLAARQGHADEAFALLREAVDHGLSHSDVVGMKDDHDLEPLRRDPRFPGLIAYGQNRAKR